MCLPIRHMRRVWRARGRTEPRLHARPAPAHGTPVRHVDPSRRRRMRIRLALAAAAALAAAGCSGDAGTLAPETASLAKGKSSPGAVYVTSNSPAGNAVLAF